MNKNFFKGFLLTLFSLFSLNLFSQTYETYRDNSGIVYNLLTYPEGETPGTCELGNNVSLELEELTLPNSISIIEGDQEEIFKVIGVADFAFSNGKTNNTANFNTFIKTIDLSACQHLQYVGQSAFMMTALEYISFNGCKYLERINDYAFYECENLNQIDLTGCEKLSFIGYEAFLGSGLNYIDLSYTILTTITENLFRSCESLEKCLLPQTLESIGDSAFQGSGLIEISIPGYVINVGNLAFSSCSLLKKIILEDSLGNPNSDYIKFGTDGSNNSFNRCQISELYLGRNLSLNSSTSSNPISPFNGQTALTQLIIGNSVNVIPAYAFVGCQALSEISIPSNVYDIGTECFKNCVELTNVILESGDEWTLKMGKDIFSGCKIEQIFLGRNIIYDPTIKAYGAFESIKTLERIEITASVINLPSRCFMNCSGLSEIVLPNSLITIEDNCFNGCSSLQSLTLPASLESIGEYCLDFTRINTITCYALVPPTANEWFLPSTMIEETGTLYVLDEALEDYKVATGWDKAFRILPIEEDVPETNFIKEIWFSADSFTFENSEDAILHLSYSPDTIELPEILWSIYNKENDLILTQTTTTPEIILDMLTVGEYLVKAEIYNTGESQVLEANAIVIILQDAGLDVITKDREVEIYNLNGILIYKGLFDEFATKYTSGLFIIKIGKDVYKMMIN